MPQNAYCQECSTRVTLTEAGACPNGHPRSALRDVREGAAAQAPAAPAAPVTVGGIEVVPGGSSTKLTAKTGLASEIIGKGIVLIPLALILVIGLWTGYAGSRAEGLSPVLSWLSAIGSLVLTGLVVVVLAKRRRKR